MLRLLAIALGFLIAGIAASAPALADKRVALVIGNGDYENVSPLPNPTNDAADMAATLEALGFEVRRADNLGKAAFEAELADFADTSARADVAIVFYAGHGMEVDRQNYLIPTDASLASDRRLRFETISLDDILVALDAVSGVRIVLLDACRNNPFADQMEVSGASRSIGRGLSRIEAPSGTVISFAAKEGRVAEDGGGRNSPFTSALLDNLTEPGLELGFLFRKVRDSVLAATGGTQEPYISASLPGNAIFLVPPQASPPVAAAPTPGGAPGPIASAPPAATPAAPPGAPLEPPPPAVAAEVERGAPLRAGEAVVTRSGLGADGIDPQATVAAILDLTAPGGPPRGQRLAGVPERAAVSAGEVGQVFAVAVDDGGGAADIYLAASSAFGLHRTADNAGWAEGMWGEGGGPGTIYVLRADNGYAPEVFAEVTLDGRANTGAALGGIAIDRQGRQLFAADLETGMIHWFSLETGAELGRYDHGIAGRAQFYDVPSGTASTLEPIGFDAGSAARVEDCPQGDFAATPACWNIADFRRRIWGVAVRTDATSGASRLYYATWGSGEFANPDWAGGGDDQRNAVWSIGIGPDGGLDRADIRRELYVPDYFTAPDDFLVHGPGHPVADIAFSACGPQDVMLLAERGGMRNLGPGAGAPFARPHESRVLRYDLGPAGEWQTAGRYDAGFYDRPVEGPPHIRSNAAGGVSFGPGFDAAWQAGVEIRNGLVWASGDALCSPLGTCYASDTGAYSDAAPTHGLQGVAPELSSVVTPEGAYSPYPQAGPASPADAPMSAYMVDLATLARGGQVAGPGGDNYDYGASLIGDIEVYQPCPEDELYAEELPPPPYDAAEVPPGESWPDDFYPADPFPEESFPEDYDPGGYPDDPGGWEGWEPSWDLAIVKSGPIECQEGGVCPYQIEFANYGPDAFAGPLAVRDQMPPGALFAGASPGWVCNPFIGQLYCQRNAHVVLGAGATTSLAISLVLPHNIAANAVQNCAAIDWDAIGIDDGPGDANDQACIVTPVLDRFDLGIAKASQSASCGAGGQCFSVIEVANHGPGKFSGTLAVAETLPAGATLASASGEWGCSQSGTDLRCSLPKTLAPGQSVSLTLGLVYPLTTPDGPLQNCARIDFAAMGSNDGFADIAPDQACDSVDIHHDGFDLEITKIGPAACDDGGLCRYEVEMTNNGPNDFADTLAFVDARPAGSSISTGPGAGWVCLPGGGPDEIKCSTAAAIALAPGESRTAEIEIQLPNPVGAESVTSCASLDWTVMALDLPGDTNDQSCATTNIGAGFDLVAAKTGDPECVEGTLCNYTLGIANAGPRKYEGTLAFTDVLPADASVEFASAGWTCIPTGAADEVACRSNSNVAVPAGASATLELGVRVPDTIIVDTIENCASLDLAEMGFSNDADASNDGPACAASAVLDADVALFGGTTCNQGSQCRFSTTAVNTGGRTFEGMLAINGELDPAIELQNVTAPGRGWSCKITGPGTYQCGRVNPLRLEPGEAQKVRLVATIPADFDHSHVIHRMWLTWPSSEGSDRNAANDANVSIIRINPPLEEEAEPGPGPQAGAPEPPEAEPEPTGPPPRPDLALTKTGPSECVMGDECTWSLNIQNNGPVDYAGMVFIDDEPPGGAATTLQGASGDWSCEASGASVGCRHGYVSLAPGQSVGLDLTFRLAGERGAYGGGAAQNCAAIARPIGALPSGMSANTGAVYAIQHALVEAGHMDRDSIDGAFGPQTGSALQAYQREHGLEVTGRPDQATVQTMLAVIRMIGGDEVAGNDADCAEFALAEPPRPECPAGSQWDEGRGACISLCRDDQRWDGQRCVSRCVSGERWTGQQCVSICTADQRWDGQRCLARCASGEQWTGQACVPVCRDNQRWDGQQCVSRCASGERWTGQSCVPLCRDDQRWDGQRCVSRCGPSERWTGQQCVSLCRNDQRWDGQRCVSRCGSGEQWNGQRCTSVCRDDQRWDGQRCLSRCDSGERWNGQRCVSQCGSGERWNGQQCVSSCKDGQRWNGQQCVSICGRGETWNGRQCVSQCPAGQRWDGQRCVSNCGPNQRFNPQLRTCVPIFQVPGTIDPGIFNPGTGRPGNTNPGNTNPGTGRPGTINPGTIRPGTINPGVINPGLVRPLPNNNNNNNQGSGGRPQIQLQIPQLQQFQRLTPR